MAKTKSITIPQTAGSSENAGEMTGFDFGTLVDDLGFSIQHCRAVIRILVDNGSEQDSFLTDHDTILESLNLLDVKLSAMHKTVHHDLNKLRQKVSKS